MAVPTGIEPAISSVTDWHVNHYTTGPLVLPSWCHLAVFLADIYIIKLRAKLQLIFTFL